MERTCPHCGAELPDTTDAYCGECREALDDELDSEESPEPDTPVKES